MREVLSYASGITVPGLLFLILYGGSKGWWVFGWQYRIKEQEAEEWKRMALASTQLAADAADTAAHAIVKVRP